MRLIAYVLALLAGAALSFEGGIYAKLGESIGKLETGFYNFFCRNYHYRVNMVIFWERKSLVYCKST